MFAQYGGFGGPSILSRSGGPSGRTGSNPIGFTGYLGANGLYSTNLNRLEATDSGTSFQVRDSYGASILGGIQGYKSTARSSTSVDLNLNYSWLKYSQVSRGLSESLAVTHSRQISRRVMWFIGANGQSTNRSLIFSNQRYSPEPIPDLPSQQEEIFDTRIYRANAGTGVTFQQSARLAFSLQAGAFGNERRSKRFVDSRGFMGGASVQYSLSRRQYVGASFQYGTFYFPGAYGETKYYSPQAFWGVSLNRIWNLTLYAGIFQAHTTRLVAVPLDPFIVELTGQRTALEIFDGNHRGFSGGISLNGNYRRWGISLSANRGITPGNGVYMTGERTTASASVSHTLGQKSSFSLFANASQMKALTQTIGNSRFYSGGASYSYRINGYLNFSSSVGAYRTEAVGQQIKFNRLMATAGLFFSPGELPLHIF